MKAIIILITFVFLTTAAPGQVSKQIGKMYEENKYQKVVKVASMYNTYVSREDEKAIADMVGRSYYALQQYDSAIYFTSRAISLDNDATYVSAWSYAYRGMAQYRLGKKEESVLDLQKSIKLDRTHNSVEVAKAFLDDVNNNSVPGPKCEFYFSQGEYKNTIEEGLKQLQKQEYKGIMELVGAAYFNIHYYDSAAYFERKAIAADKDATLVSGWAHAYLGMALYHKNEKEAAIKELRKAIELNKTSNSVRKAENFLDDIINGRSLAIDSLHQVIKDQLNSNNYRAAANTALAAIATNPDDATSWDQLTTAYCWLHNYDSSLYCGQKTIALDKEQSNISCEAHYHIGIDHYMKNNRQGAEDEFTAAINGHASDNLRKKVKNTQALTGFNDTYDHWKTVETDNIIFHFQNKKSIDNVDALMEKYEKEYNNARNVLSVPLPKKIDLFVWEREALAKNALQSDKDVVHTNGDLCVAHVAQDNNRTSEILRILGHWQKNQ